MSPDEQVGANVRTLRHDRTQQSVADAMRAYGWKWSQATVWSVETGERPLRLLEAMDLAHVLGIETATVLARDVVPPKPDEPTGRFAVVLDAIGVAWVRYNPVGAASWLPENAGASGHLTHRTYAEIEAVKVLSEGVTS